MERRKLLEVENLKISFRSSDSTVTAVSGVSFHVNERETLGIVGESGCGKSITSLAIMRLLPPAISHVDGMIQFAGRDLLKLPEKDMFDIRGQQISMVFQEPMTSLNPVYTIGKQVDEVILLHRNISSKEARKETLEMLKKVGIPRPEALSREYPYQLSGGMRQRVMIAMALICGPELLIADEPTTALDVTIQAQILDLMRQMRQETGASIMMITHDLGVVAEMCERVMVMYAGQIVEEADVVSLFKNPQHPYTIGLMQSIPKHDKKLSRLIPIPGQVPPLSAMPPGCRFAPRCSKVMPQCLTENPPLLSLEDGHACRCWLYGKGGERDYGAR
jgi:peptide/nickel transport system ATP-binding protein